MSNEFNLQFKKIRILYRINLNWFHSTSGSFYLLIKNLSPKHIFPLLLPVLRKKKTSTTNSASFLHYASAARHRHRKNRARSLMSVYFWRIAAALLPPILNHPPPVFVEWHESSRPAERREFRRPWRGLFEVDFHTVEGSVQCD